jgi:hypothetical protein
MLIIVIYNWNLSVWLPYLILIDILQGLHIVLCILLWSFIFFIVSLHSLREHRAVTKFRHLTQFLASNLTSFHVLPWCLISSRIVLRHVVWGRPRDLDPWGFHSRAAFAMSPGGRQSVWPSHPHFLCRISSSIGFCLALAHSSLFDIWTGQNIFNILRMHLLIIFSMLKYNNVLSALYDWVRNYILASLSLFFYEIVVIIISGF